MLDYHSNITSQQKTIHPKMNNWANQPFVMSARPKINQLPFLNNLKAMRQFLVALKNQKLRKSLYVITQAQIQKKQVNDVYKHEKAKLSVMDLISQQGKFQQLSNTVQSNFNRHSVSPIMQTGTFQEQEKISIQKKPISSTQNLQVKIKPPIITKKNRLAQELNKLGHQLEETYDQVEQLQKIFYTLCQFYSNNRKTVDNNLKMKQQKELIKQKIQQYEERIEGNHAHIKKIQGQQSSFLNLYRKNLIQYVKSVFEYNKQSDILLTTSNNLQKKFPIQTETNIQNKNLLNSQQLSQSSSSEDTQNNALKITLKFNLIKTQLERIKTDKKNSQQNKNKDKKILKNQNNDNTFSKLYVSEIFNL